MKELIGDDAEVMKICKRLGVAGLVKKSLRKGKAIAFIREDYVIAAFTDGMIAAKATGPIEAAELLLKFASTVGACSPKVVRR
jgi:hypothetical protein